MANSANSRDGKPLNVGDQCVVLGTIVSIAGGDTGAVVVKLINSGSNVSVQAQDIGASTQTL